MMTTTGIFWDVFDDLAVVLLDIGMVVLKKLKMKIQHRLFSNQCLLDTSSLCSLICVPDSFL